MRLHRRTRHRLRPEGKRLAGASLWRALLVCPFLCDENRLPCAWPAPADTSTGPASERQEGTTEGQEDTRHVPHAERLRPALRGTCRTVGLSSTATLPLRGPGLPLPPPRILSHLQIIRSPSKSRREKARARREKRGRPGSPWRQGATTESRTTALHRRASEKRASARGLVLQQRGPAPQADNRKLPHSPPALGSPAVVNCREHPQHFS